MTPVSLSTRQRAEYWAYRFVVRRLARLSDASLRKWILRTARVFRKLLRRRDRIAAANLARVFPEKSDAERESILQLCWEHFVGMVFRYLRGADPRVASRNVIIENQHYLDEALAQGKGLIAVTAHYGEWEGAAAAAATAGVEAIAIARPLDNPLLHEEMHHARTSHGILIVDRRKAARQMLQALREKKVVILLIDQAVKPREGILLPFLGKPAWTATSPAKLAMKTGAPILPLFCVPDGEGIRIELEKPFTVESLPEEDRSVEAILTRLNGNIERRILERPELWLWMHDRWKRSGS